MCQININNISRSIQNYNKLMLNFISSANTTVSAQANTYYGTHLWLTGEQTSSGLILNTSFNQISELQLFLSPLNLTHNSTNHFLIKSIVPMADRTNLDKYSITESNVPKNQSLSNIRIAKVQYINPASFIVNVKVSNPGTFTLVYSQNYDPGWEIKNTGHMSAKHIIVNNFMNAWIISFSQSGNFSIHIFFKSENLVDYYGYVSVASSLVLTAFYMAISMRRKNKKVS